MNWIIGSGVLCVLATVFSAWALIVFSKPQQFIWALLSVFTTVFAAVQAGFFVAFIVLEKLLEIQADYMH